MAERPSQTGRFMPCQGSAYVLKLDAAAAAQRAQMRAAERAGKRVAVRFEKPSKPWDKVRR